MNTPTRNATVRAAIEDLLKALTVFEAVIAPPPLNGLNRLVAVNEVFLALAGEREYPGPEAGSLEDAVQRTATRLKSRLLGAAESSSIVIDSIRRERVTLAAKFTDPAVPALRPGIDLDEFGVVAIMVPHLGEVTAGLYDTLAQDSPVRKYITAADTIELPGSGRCIVLAIDSKLPTVLDLFTVLTLTRRAASVITSNRQQEEAIARRKEQERKQREANDPLHHVKVLEKKIAELQDAKAGV